MARDHARIFTAIWSDPEFKRLEKDPQRMYFVLVSQHRLTYAGVLDYLPARLASLAADDGIEAVEKAVAALEATRFVVVDQDTQEILVRSFVRHDGLLATPNMVKAMLKDRDGIISESLREALDDELARAYEERPDLAGWKVVERSRKALWEHLRQKGSAKGSAKGSVKGSGQ